jgi:hypothetical protein
MDSMSFIVGVKLSAALAGVTPAPEIRTTLAAADMHERASNSRIGLCIMPPLSDNCESNAEVCHKARTIDEYRGEFTGTEEPVIIARISLNISLHVLLLPYGRKRT